MALQKHKAGDPMPMSKYKGVCANICENKKYIRWKSQLMVSGKLEYSYHQTEREAAKRYDMYLIRAGRQPVNILKPK